MTGERGNEKMLRGANIKPYLHLKWLLECFQTDVLPQAKQSVILLTKERSHTFNISFRHHTYSIKIEKLSEPAGNFKFALVFYFLQHIEFFP